MISALLQWGNMRGNSRCTRDGFRNGDNNLALPFNLHQPPQRIWIKSRVPSRLFSLALRVPHLMLAGLAQRLAENCRTVTLQLIPCG